MGEVVYHLLGHFDKVVQDSLLPQPDLNAVSQVEGKFRLGPQNLLIHFDGGLVLKQLLL